MEIRFEQPDDLDAIRTLTSEAFQNAPHSSHNEAGIVDALRKAGALIISLVAVEDGVIVGHVTFSPVTINEEAKGWYGLGPVSVRPDRQRKGIGERLIRTGLDQLRSIDAKGCVVLGEPAYYSRFGFASDHNLRYGNVPLEYFQRLAFTQAMPVGEVFYHPAFNTE